uniref:Uncharacterized protein n=1 Tax=viral metagenome TaxID=1070528 RepID=A0A6C0JUL7_9ZZZZ
MDYSRFFYYCSKGNLKEIKYQITHDENFKTEWITDNLYGPSALGEACDSKSIGLIQYLLQYVDNIDIEYIDFHEMNIEILKLFLAHGKFNDDIRKMQLYSDFTDKNDTFTKQYKKFMKRAKPLVDEYLFRLDGPIYNENIIG